MGRKRKSRRSWIVAGLLLGAVAYWGPGLWHSDAGAPASAGAGAGAQPAAPPVSVATVVAQNVNQFSEFSGLIEAVDAVDVRPRVSGQIMAVHFADGADVKKGQPLFTIDARPFEAELLRSKGALATAESARANALQDLARAKQLIKSKAISQSEFELRVSAANQAIGSVDSARGAVRAAEVNLEYTRITAPISGRVGRAEITVGNLVEAGANAPLLARIVTISPLYVSFSLDEKTFLNTIQGVPASKLKTIPVEIGLGNESGTPTAATIHSFDNQLVAGSGTIRVRAQVENADARLVPGLFARVRIGAPDATPSILIHPTAVGTDQNKKFVLVVAAGNKAEYREVVMDGMVDGLQVVKSGLQAGEQIVVNGLQNLRPGASLLPQMVEMRTLKPAASTAGAAVDTKAAP